MHGEGRLLQLLSLSLSSCYPYHPAGVMCLFKAATHHVAFASGVRGSAWLRGHPNLRFSRSEQNLAGGGELNLTLPLQVHRVVRVPFSRFSARRGVLSPTTSRGRARAVAIPLAVLMRRALRAVYGSSPNTIALSGPATTLSASLSPRYGANETPWPQYPMAQ